MSDIIKRIAEDKCGDLSPNELENLKNWRLQRLMNSSVNLKNPLFLSFRRQDWAQYLNDDIKTFKEYEDGLQRWMKEDREGALEYKHYTGTFMSG